MRAPKPAAGGAVAVQVDHSRRSLLVGGEPFFGTGWYSGTGNGTGASAFTPDSGKGHWSESIYTRIEMQARLGDNMMMPCATSFFALPPSDRKACRGAGTGSTNLTRR